MIVDEETPLRERFWHPQAGQTVLDVGCFIGAWTLPALNAGAHVHAFDANTTQLEALRELADGDPNLTIVRARVGRSYSYELALQIPITMRPIAGQWIGIDDYVRERGLRVAWIKIDVEGGELAVLQSAKETLERDRPRLIVEEHSLVYPDVLRGNLADVLQLLWEADYSTQVIPLRGERWPIHIIAEPA